MAEEAGQAEAGESVAGMGVGERGIGGQEFGYALHAAERAGFEEIGRAGTQQQRRQLGMAGVDGPLDGRGAVRRARVLKRGVGRKQCAHFVRVSVSNGIEDHAPSMQQTPRARLSDLANSLPLLCWQ